MKKIDKDLDVKFKELTDNIKSLTDNNILSIEAEDSERLKKIITRIKELMLWLSKNIHEAFVSFSDYVKSMNLRNNAIESKYKALDPSKYESASKVIRRNLVFLTGSNGRVISSNDTRKLIRKFDSEILDTFTAMEGMLMQYKAKLSDYMTGKLNNVPRMDIFEILRRTNNFKGTDERIVSSFTEINYEIVVDKVADGAISASFFLPEYTSNNDYYDLPKKADLMVLHNALGNFIELSKKYSKSIDMTSKRLNKIATDIVAIVNSKENDLEFIERGNKILSSRDFNQVALFSAIATFIKISRFNLKVINLISSELLRILQTASREQKYGTAE